MPDNTEWLTARQLAERLSWHPSETTVWRWMNEGKVQTRKVSLSTKRNIRRIPASEVARLEKLFAQPDATDLTN